MPPNHFESEVESFLEGSHGDRTHIKRADHHTVTPLCGTLLWQGQGAPHDQSLKAKLAARMAGGRATRRLEIRRATSRYYASG